jgi:elongation factor P
MNININDIKNGMTVLIDGTLCLIQEFQHVKPGKGPAFVRIKLKNLKTGSTVEQTFNTNIKITKAHIDKNSVQYLYASGDNFVFMNNETYEQIEVPRSILGEDANYVKEGIDISIDFYEGEIIGITLPEKIEYKIIETSEAVKGNTATNAQKDATIETGKVIKVPLFINEGEKIIISTKDGKYSSRA